MIDFDSWHPYVRIAFLLAPLVIGLPGLFMIVLISYRDLDTIFATFPNSKYVRGQRVMWGTNTLPSRVMLVSHLASVVFFPNGHIKRGELDEHELQRLPAPIKRRIVIAFRFCAGGMAWFLLVVVVLKLSGR